MKEKAINNIALINEQIIKNKASVIEMCAEVLKLVAQVEDDSLRYRATDDSEIFSKLTGSGNLMLFWYKEKIRYISQKMKQESKDESL